MSSPVSGSVSYTYLDMMGNFGLDQTKEDRFIVAKIANGKAWKTEANSPNNIVTRSDEKILDELSGSNTRKFSNICLSGPPAEIDSTLAYLFSNKNNYYHWMIQILPQLHLIREAGINLNDVDYYAFYHQIREKFKIQTLEKLGIPASKILATHSHPYLQAKQLLVTSLVPIFPQKWACDFLRTEFLPQGAYQSFEKRLDYLYISRKNASYRKIINEDILIDRLSQLGFVSIHLEDLSVLEQATLFSNAKIVVSPHGAGLTNLVFCSSGAKVVEILIPSFIRNMYRVISKYMNLEYYRFTAGEVDNHNSELDRDKHIKLDIEELGSFVRTLLSQGV